MTCTAPLTAYYSREVNPVTGKRGITFSRSASLTGRPINVGCGQCAHCRLDRSADWAVRCVHESKLYAENCFLTLTYDDEHLPKSGPWPSLVKRDLSLFLKKLHNRLLKKRGYGIRYYACGEYGERNGRPHYHAIIFNYDFPDKKFYKQNKRGEPLFTSELLDDIWGLGLCSIGAVTFESCAYVARYVIDKINGDLADDKYTWMDASTGELVSIVKEFPVMSRRPGIGYGWFLRYYQEFYRDDAVVLEGRERLPPRFYDKMFAAIDPRSFERIKRRRVRRSLVHKCNQTTRRLRAKEVILLKRLSLNRRDMR